MSEDTTYSLNIAHLSDLHFSKITLNPAQFLSKRWLGNVNLLFSRGKKVGSKRLPRLVDLLKELHTNLVIITGDLTSTSHEAEFKRAHRFIESLKEAEMDVVVLPGNHDHYTRQAYRQRHFYNYFPEHLHPEEDNIIPASLREHAIAVKPLDLGWVLVALDTALATSLVSSRGLFSKTLEKRLRRILSMIPKDRHVIVANHFPFFKQESARKMLLRGDALKQILCEFPNVKLYLHGHTHRTSLADLRGNNLPIILDSGSTGLQPRQSWNRLLLKEHELTVQQFESVDQEWEAYNTETFHL